MGIVQRKGIVTGAVVVACLLTAARCGSSTSPAQGSPTAPSPSSGVPAPAPTFTVPDPAAEPRAVENRNDWPSALGKVCWAHVESAHMITSFAVPIVAGEPLYSNDYIADDTRHNAVLAALSTVDGIAGSVTDDVPEAARPFVAFLASESEVLHDAVASDSGPQGLRDCHTLFFDALGDSEGWLGVRPFVAAAKASPDCDLGASP